MGSWWNTTQPQKNEIIPSAATWMDLQITILSEVRQRKANIWYHLYVESKKRYKRIYLQNKLTDIENKLMVTKGGEENKLGVWD